MKKVNWLQYLILCFPILDFITSIATWNNYPSLGLIIKGILLIYASIYLIKNSKNKRKTYLIFGILIIYGMTDISLWYFQDKTVLKEEITNLIKIFYLPILIYFFDEYKKTFQSKKIIVYLLIIFLLLYLIPFPFDLGHNINEIYPNKDLYLSYFYVGNELANIFIILTPIALIKLIDDKNKWLLPILLLVLCMLYLLGTKTMYISVLLICCYLIYYYHKKLFPIIKKRLNLMIPFILIISIFMIIWIPKSNFYKNIETSLNYYEITSIKELFTIKEINHIIYSNRLDFLKNIHEYYKTSSMQEKILGIGRSKINKIKDIEIDIFDIFYSIGIVGFIIYLLVFILILKDIKILSTYKFIFILLVIISLFSGHVLISPMTSSYLAYIFSANKEEQLEKRLK